MNWFRRNKKNILTSTKEKKDSPVGIWYKTSTGKIIETEELEKNLYVSPEDDFHIRIGSNQYFSILFDDNEFFELDTNVESIDFLNFFDTKFYSDRIIEAKNKTGLTDALRNAVGRVHGRNLVLSCMDFSFIGGSLGSVMGEKISRGIDYSIQKKYPFMIICQSGGARMMESALSLMQMAKVQAKLVQLANHKLPYISLLTNPTFGGVTASFAMIADIIIAEPKAFIGFAGPRVIKESIGKDLPKGFQTSEFLLEKGFIDFILHRKILKNKLSLILSYFN